MLCFWESDQCLLSLLQKETDWQTNLFVKTLGTLLYSTIDPLLIHLLCTFDKEGRMQLLQRVCSIGVSKYCLSVLKQSRVVWGNMPTEENKTDIERTLKGFAKLVLEEDYET